MAILFHILKFKILSFLKINFTFKIDSLFKNVGSFLVYTAFAAGAFLFSFESVKYLLEEMKVGLFLLHEFFSIALFIFFIAVNVGNIIVSYSTLYKSQEVNFLFTKPIPPSTIFVIKVLDNFFYSSSTLILILLSIIGGYAYYLGFSIVDVLILFLFNFIPFMLSAASLGIIILLLLVKLSTLVGIRKVITGLGVIYLSFLYLFFNVTSPIELVDQVMKYYPNVDLYFGNYIPDVIKYLPNLWLSNAMYWIARDNYAAAGSSFYLQIVLSIVLFLLALILGRRWYHQTWFYDFRLKKKKSNNINEEFFSFEKKSRLKLLHSSLLKREYHNFFREPTQVFHSIVLLLLILLFVSSVSSVTNLEKFNVFLLTVIYLSLFIFNIFLVATLSLRFVFPLVSLEGKAFWKIKSAPISTLNVLRLKLTPYFIIIIFISLLLNLVINAQFGFNILVTTSIIMFFVTSSLILLNFSIGGLFANFSEKNPIRLASSQGASLSFLINIFIMIGLIMVLYFPMLNYFDAFINETTFVISELYFALGVVVSFSLIIFLVSHRMILRVVKKDF